MAKSSKTSTYILLILVVAIWGVIAYKVIEARSGNDIGAGSILSGKRNLKDSAYALTLSYRDPFLNTPAPAKYKERVAAIKQIKPEAKKPTVSYSSLLSVVKGRITYNGLVANKSTNGKLGIVQINGEVIHVRISQHVDSLLVVNITKDSISLKGRYHYTILRVQ